jgi:hypothetical protein
MMEVVSTSETSANLCEITRRNIPEDSPRHVNVNQHSEGIFYKYCRGSSGSLVSDYGLDDRRSRFDPRQGQRIFLLAPASRPALGSTQPPIQWVPGVLCPGVKRGRGVMLTTHPHLVPRLIMSRSYTSSPPRRLRGV